MRLLGGLLVAMPHGISVAGTPICAAVTVVGTVHVVTPAVAATVPEEKNVCEPDMKVRPRTLYPKR